MRGPEICQHCELVAIPAWARRRPLRALADPWSDDAHGARSLPHTCPHPVLYVLQKVKRADPSGEAGSLAATGTFIAVLFLET